jgi:hypothetical protein
LVARLAATGRPLLVPLSKHVSMRLTWVCVAGVWGVYAVCVQGSVRRVCRSLRGTADR